MKKLAFTGLAAALVTATAAYAADLETVTVTGTVDRSGSDFLTTANTVLTSDDLAKWSATKLDQALLYVPGVNAGYASSNHYNLFRTQGFTSEVAVDGASGTVNNAYYVQTPNLYGVERVEVVKGANSVLFGASDAGGSVNYVLKKPLNQNRTSLHFGFGLPQYYAAGLDFNRLVSERWAYRVVTLFQNYTGQKDGTTSQDFYVAPSARWTFNKDTVFTFTGSVKKTDGVPSQFVVPAVFNAWTPEGAEKLPSTAYFGEPKTSAVHNLETNLGARVEHNFDQDTKLSFDYRFTNLNSHYEDLVPGAAVWVPNPNAPAAQPVAGQPVAGQPVAGQPANAQQVPAGTYYYQRAHTYVQGNFSSHYLDLRGTRTFKFNDYVTNTLVAGYSFYFTKLGGYQGVNPGANLGGVAEPALRIDPHNFKAQDARVVFPDTLKVRVDENTIQHSAYLANTVEVANSLFVNAGVRWDYNLGDVAHKGNFRQVNLAVVSHGASVAPAAAAGAGAPGAGAPGAAGGAPAGQPALYSVVDTTKRGEFHLNNLSKSVGAVYKFSFGLQPYANYSESFKPRANSVFDKDLRAARQAEFDRWEAAVGAEVTQLATQENQTVDVTDREAVNAFLGGLAAGQDQAKAAKAGTLLGKYAQYDRYVAIDTAANEEFQPETARSFTVGARFVPNNWNAVLDVNYFYTKQLNPVDRDDLTGTFVQTKKYVQVQGVAASLKTDVTDWLSVGANYTWQKSEQVRTKQFVGFGYAAVAEADQKAEEVPFTPVHSGGLTVDFHFDNGLAFGGGVRYYGGAVSNYPAVNQNARRGDIFPAPADLAAYEEFTKAHTHTDGVVLYDLNASFGNDKFRLGVTATNLLNTEYVSGCNSVCYYGEPRNVKAVLDVTF